MRIVQQTVSSVHPHHRQLPIRSIHYKTWRKFPISANHSQSELSLSFFFSFCCTFWWLIIYPKVCVCVWVVCASCRHLRIFMTPPLTLWATVLGVVQANIDWLAGWPLAKICMHRISSGPFSCLGFDRWFSTVFDSALTIDPSQIEDFLSHH